MQPVEGFRVGAKRHDDDTMSCHVMSCNVMSYHILSHHITSHHII